MNLALSTDFNRFLENTLRYSLFFTLFILPFIPFYSSGQDGLALPINSLIILPISIFCLILFSFSSKNSRLQIDSTILTITITLSVFTITVILFTLNSFPNSAIVRAAFIFTMCITIQSLYWLKVSKDLILRFVFCALFIQLIYGLIQYFFLTGSSEFVVSDNRPVGIFLQVNVMATAIVINLFLCLYLIAKNTEKKLLPLIYTYLILAPLIIYLCNSRTAYLSIAIGFIIYFFQSGNSSLKSVKNFWKILVLGIILTLFFIFFFEHGIKSEKQILNPGIRLDIYLHSIWMFIQKPFLGWGFGEFIPQFYYSMIERFQAGEIESVVPGFTMHPHNELALWAIEGGLIGLGFLLFILTKVIQRLKLNKTTVGSSKISFGLVILAPLFIHMMFEHPFYTSSYMLIVFILLFYVFTTQETENFNKHIHKSIKILMISFSVILAPVLLAIFISSIKSTQYIKTGDKIVRSEILSDFPSRYYIVQMDLLIDSQNARKQANPESIEKVNRQIRSTLDYLPVLSLANEFKINCLNLNNCSKSDETFIREKFPQLD